MKLVRPLLPLNQLTVFLMQDISISVDVDISRKARSKYAYNNTFSGAIGEPSLSTVIRLSVLIRSRS